ncbi:hypothetical protein T261_7368 [Streptomyces lydicus]|nr:hypothetical protein T261_7368 [Streptomyces lydicus]
MYGVPITSSGAFSSAYDFGCMTFDVRLPERGRPEYLPYSRRGIPGNNPRPNPCRSLPRRARSTLAPLDAGQSHRAAEAGPGYDPAAAGAGGVQNSCDPA